MSTQQPPELIIEAGRGEARYWQDLWAFRGLFYFLAWRDILVRYKQTVIGVSWALIRPLITTVVFTVVFGKLARLPSSGDSPYAITVLAALLPWMFFSQALSDCSNSLVGNANLVSKIYFPRLIVPASSVIVSLVDFLIVAVILAVMMVSYQYLPDWRVLCLPFFLVVAFVTALAAGLWFAALNVRYRDFRHIVPFVVQIGLYLSPVGFTSSVVPEQWRFLYSLNPMVGVIDGFRWSLLRGNATIQWDAFAIGILLVVLLLSTGLRYFRKVERTFADVI